MRHGAALVLVEVRKRARGDYGDAFASVHGRKRARIVHAARMYLAAHPQEARNEVRFDVVAVDGADKIEWLAAAFTADDERSKR